MSFLRRRSARTRDLSEYELEILRLLGGEAYGRASRSERQEMLRDLFAVEPGEQDRLGEAFKSLHRDGYVKKTFLADVLITGAGREWLGRTP